MKSTICCQHIVLNIICILILINVGKTQQNVSAKPGKCPSKMEPTCLDGERSECQTDNDCKQDSKCCSNGCHKMCLIPVRTGCQQLRRQLEMQPLGDGFVPMCRADGEFEPIQCKGDGECWCVDGRGLELAGTRARSASTINCTRPKGCASYVCRMLCPYGFELDNQGCPLCECRNLCKRMKCPAGQECHLEDVPCSNDQCPPLPTCKQPRYLDRQCPLGEPIATPDNKNPFLCGVQPNKPQCPKNYICNVLLGNDYGVCCPLYDFKPGVCPPSDIVGIDGFCSETCEADSTCLDVSKCCQTVDCGRQCIRPLNASLCQQQKAVVELLLGSNPDYSAYIPQCTELGEFLSRQCTTNGKLCWCVDQVGMQVRGSLGPAKTVSCLTDRGTVTQESVVTVVKTHCAEISCAAECAVGFKTDDTGCTICECIDPCKEINCPSHMDCMILTEEPCISPTCPPIATCIQRSVENFCKEGTNPLTMEGQIGNCSKDDCPEGYRCKLLPDNDTGVCCPVDANPISELACPDDIPRLDTCPNVTCNSDGECLEGRKCCPEASCGSICVFPKPVRLPTMCEYLRDVSLKLGNNTLAVSMPTCRFDGSYEPVQCHGASCWCVDDFGTELPGSRVENKEKANCNKARALKPCIGLLCRIGCDYGFEIDRLGCPVCECRNPCVGAKCSPGQVCQMVVPQDCRGGWCPAVPQCIEDQLPFCPVGQPMLYKDDVPIPCDPQAAYQQCPITHTCISDAKSLRGVCCLRLDSIDRTAEEQLESKTIFGQCPYLIQSLNSCEFECRNDSQCEAGLKCCSTGCGTHCTSPLFFTACQHRRYIAKEMKNAPACKESDGSFKSRQCNDNGRCTCVDDMGNPVPGLVDKNCLVVNECKPIEDCHLDCENGFQLGEDGCQICSCRNPCQDVKCYNPREICHLLSVTCTSQPCPPVALCILPSDNPCGTGEPLPNRRCGPAEDSRCPSSHNCYLNPLFPLSDGVCCLKPKETCLQEINVGMCRSSHPRWYFDTESNTCQPFTYGGCGGNQNNFYTEEECQLICNVAKTDCEFARERNLAIRKNRNKVIYVPKCKKKTGSWDPIQCLEAVGLCWCVDPRGQQIANSVVRGTPSCDSLRAARHFNRQTAICENGEVVHFCQKNLCEGASCGAYPDASCRIDPCGSCTARFYNMHNHLLDCSSGLTACLAEVHRVLESTSRLRRHRRSIFQEEEMLALESQLPFNRHLTVASRTAIVLAPHIRSMLRHLRTVLTETAVKPGVCPPPSLLTMLRSLSWQCSHTCMLDGQCPGSQKCCLGSCGMECTEIEEEHPVLMSVMPPTCSAEGGYAVVQHQEQLSWCVDKYGQPFHHTLTRGSVRCLKNGTVIHKKDKGPVCPSSNVQPLVCRNQCLESFCHQHPEAVCVADPCNGCATHFINVRGEKVHCEDKCHQPVEKGSCNGKQIRYAFVARTGRCQEFEYSGCGGNDNNFPSKEDCRLQCRESQPVCDQPRQTGMCRAFWVRWFYNRNTYKCEKFVYGGCGGNQNNFASEEQCHATCPDVVFCPWAPIDEELKGCSRVQRCANATCPLHPEATCTVKPCECLPVFVDAKGLELDCQELPRLVMPQVTSLTPCQHRLSLRGQGEPQCAKDGSFLPTQCYATGDCWCVDEAGNQIPRADTSRCQLVRIERVEVTANMELEDGLQHGHLVAAETKLLANQLLQHLSVKPPRDLVVEDRPDGSLRLSFTLLDDNKVFAAFRLEELVKSNRLKLVMTQGTMAADYKKWHFYYVADSATMAADSVTKGFRASPDGPVVVALVGTLTLILLLLVAMVLYRRSKGNKETGKNSLVTLMFSSPLYDFVTRKWQTRDGEDKIQKKVATVDESIQNQQNSAKALDESHA